MYGTLLTITLLSAATYCHAATSTPPSNRDVAQAAAVLGFTPDALAVMDVYGGEVTTLLLRLTEHYADFQSLQGDSLQLSLAITNQRMAEATLRSDPDDEDAQALLNQAISTRAALVPSIDQARDSLVDTLLVDLAEAGLVAQVIGVEGDLLKLPPAYRLAVSTQDEAQTLAWALKLERTLERIDDPEAQMPQDATNAINAAESQYNVQLGITRTNTHAQDNRLRLEQWMTDG